ncbi:MAG: shikimate dehydrogenase [Parvularculaceae bacterium]
MNKPEIRKAGVIGWPVAHSLSPLIHRTWAAREGADISYERIPVEPNDEAFAEKIGQLRVEGYRGVNVTIPHKEHALKIADSASATARAVGAANMLTFSDDELLADNSDVEGFAAALRAADPEAGKCATALILGAGGAAKGVLYALKERLGARRVIISNRTKARAETLDAEVADWSARNTAAADADIIVNTTSLGMTGNPPLDFHCSGLKPGAVVFDIVYSPLETPLLTAAKARGLRTVDGLEMLMRQAVPGYRAWLGTKADVDADLRARLEAALKGGAR